MSARLSGSRHLASHPPSQHVPACCPRNARMVNKSNILNNRSLLFSSNRRCICLFLKAEFSCLSFSYFFSLSLCLSPSLSLSLSLRSIFPTNCRDGGGSASGRKSAHAQHVFKIVFTHRIHEARYMQSRTATEIGGEDLRVERGAHENKLDVMALLEQLPHENQKKVPAYGNKRVLSTSTKRQGRGRSGN